jgi:hypothetical protein
MMIVLREVRGGDREQVRRQASVLNVVKNTMVRRGKEHMMCHEIAFMALKRLNYRLPDQPIEDRCCSVDFAGLLRFSGIDGPVWNYVDGLLHQLILNVHEIMGAPPLEFTFHVLSEKTLVLTVRDARAVDHRMACLAATTLMLSPQVVRFPYIKRDVLGMIARMIWATRMYDCWAPESSAKKRKVAAASVLESTKYTEFDMPAFEIEWDNAQGSGSDDSGSDEEADSFSMHSEESSFESDE